MHLSRVNSLPSVADTARQATVEYEGFDNPSGIPSILLVENQGSAKPVGCQGQECGIPQNCGHLILPPVLSHMALPIKASTAELRE